MFLLFTNPTEILSYYTQSYRYELGMNLAAKN